MSKLLGCLCFGWKTYSSNFGILTTLYSRGSYRTTYPSKQNSQMIINIARRSFHWCCHLICTSQRGNTSAQNRGSTQGPVENRYNCAYEPYSQINYPFTHKNEKYLSGLAHVMHALTAWSQVRVTPRSEEFSLEIYNVKNHLENKKNDAKWLFGHPSKHSQSEINKCPVVCPSQ